MKRYHIITEQDLSRSDLTQVLETNRITDLLLIHLSEQINQPLAKSISERLDSLGYPTQIVTQTASHDIPGYLNHKFEWCAHTGWIWENYVSHSWVNRNVVKQSYNPEYLYNPNIKPDSALTRRQYENAIKKFLCFLGKVRFDNRVIFWDSFVASGVYKTSEYSYYNLKPGSEAHQQQADTLNHLADRLRSDPETWHDLHRVCDIDLSHAIPESEPGVNNLFHCGYPTDPLIYQNTSASLVCETWTPGDLPPFLTEKTYRTIQNCHPFVLFADPHSDDYLMSQGYETFQSEFGYVSDPGIFIKNHDSDSLIKFITDISSHWAENFQVNHDILKSKTQHNRYQWIKNCVTDQNRISELCDGEIFSRISQPITDLRHHMYTHFGIYLDPSYHP